MTVQTDEESLDTVLTFLMFDAASHGYHVPRSPAAEQLLSWAWSSFLFSLSDFRSRHKNQSARLFAQDVSRSRTTCFCRRIRCCCAGMFGGVGGQGSTNGWKQVAGDLCAVAILSVYHRSVSWRRAWELRQFRDVVRKFFCINVVSKRRTREGSSNAGTRDQE